MQYNVPQFIEIEDHIVGPLTAKQLGWLAIGGVLLLVVWRVFDTSTFIFIAIFVGGLFGALAFYRPNGQSFIKFILSSVYFAFRPKMYAWKKVPGIIKIKKKERKVVKVIPKKILTKEKVEELSNILDK
jgi:hypothetical protein